MAPVDEHVIVGDASPHTHASAVNVAVDDAHGMLAKKTATPSPAAIVDDETATLGGPPSLPTSESSSVGESLSMKSQPEMSKRTLPARSTNKALPTLSATSVSVRLSFHVALSAASAPPPPDEALLPTSDEF